MVCAPFLAQPPITLLSRQPPPSPLALCILPPIARLSHFAVIQIASLSDDQDDQSNADPALQDCSDSHLILCSSCSDSPSFSATRHEISTLFSVQGKHLFVPLYSIAMHKTAITHFFLAYFFTFFHPSASRSLCLSGGVVVKALKNWTNLKLFYRSFFCWQPLARRPWHSN